MGRKYIIGMLVEDQPGVLTKIAGLFARRGFNIDTITVGKTSDERISKMIFTAIGDDAVIEQLMKQVNKLVDVIKVSELKPEEALIRELCMIKVSIKNDKEKQDLLKYSDIYKVKIVDITHKSIIFEIVGEPQKIDSFINLVKRHGIREISRTGVTAMNRGIKSIGDKK